MTSEQPPGGEVPGTGAGGGSNGLAVAGFILSLCAVVVLSLPTLGIPIWSLGVVFSGIGYSRAKAPGSPGRGLAIAGLAITFGVMVLLVTLVIINRQGN